MSTFSDRLKRARIAAGYEHASDCAYALGVEPPTYRYWERGGASPDLGMLLRICRLLETTPNDLLGVRASGRCEGPRHGIRGAA